MTRAAFVLLLLLLAAVQSGQAREKTTCENNIVSATVVATYCSHAAGSDDIVDLMILWRGRAGWFRSDTTGGSRYSSGRSVIGGGTGGHVTQDSGGAIRYDANFDTGTVTIRDLPAIALDKVNAVLVDGVDRPDGGHVQRTLNVVPRVTLGGDHNLKVISSSRALVAFLQCEVPMPSSRSTVPQPPVVTVCEKLGGSAR